MYELTWVEHSGRFGGYVCEDLETAYFFLDMYAICKIPARIWKREV